MHKSSRLWTTISFAIVENKWIVILIMLLGLGLKVSPQSYLGLYYINYISSERYLKGAQDPVNTFEGSGLRVEIQALRTNLKNDKIVS